MNFSLRNIIIGIVVLILAVAVPVTIKLVQQQQQLKSQAAGEFICDGTPEQNFCIQFLDDATRTGNIVVGGQVAVIVVGRSGETKVSLDGTYKTSDVDVLYSGGGTNPCTGDQSYQFCWKFIIPTVENKSYREIFKSEDAPSGLVAGTFQPQAPPAQTVTVNVSGKVTDSTNDQRGVERVTVGLFTSDGNTTTDGPTAITSADGSYSLSTTGPIVSYAVRITNVPKEFDSNSSRTSGGSRSYETQPANGGCKNSCHFTLTPLISGVEGAACGPVTINNKDIRLQTLAPDKTYPVSITMNNTSEDKNWKATYSLRWTGSDNDRNDLGLTVTRLNTDKVVQNGATHTFPSVNITPAVARDYTFKWQMFNDSNQPFGGACEVPVKVGTGQGDPGSTPTPVPGEFDFDVDTDGNVTVIQGSSITQSVEVVRRDSKAGSPQVILSASGFPSGVTHHFSSVSCTPTVNSPCTKTLTIDAPSDAAAVTNTITITAKFGSLEKQTNFDLTVKPAVTSFNFSLSNIADITLTQGQADPGRSVTVSRSAGNAEEVKLSVVGDIGGAEFALKPSESCKPDNNNRCQRILTFDTSKAVPGEYVAEVEGRATGNRTQVSNPFRLKINAGATPTPTPTATPTPTPTPTPAPVKKTLCFAFGEGPEGKTAVDGVKDCSNIDNKLVFPYTSEPAKINGYAFKDQTAGVKTIFVKFIGVLGTAPVSDSKQLSIRLDPNPTISNASCTHSSSGVGTDIKITGTGFGARGKGKVKVGGQELTPDSWDETTNIITGKLDQRLEGRIAVEVTTDDGRSAKGECVVNTTTITFKTLMQCKSAGSFEASNVDIKVFEAVPLSTNAKVPEPVLRQKISLNKDGEPQNFAPKFEKKKKYQLIIKAPGTIARRVDFDTKDGGTANLENPIRLPQGDVAPANSPDGKINALDKSELIRQWNIITDVVKSADLNGDSRVNSIDYACMRVNFNATDDTYSAPTVSPSASATPTPSPTPAVSPSPTPGGQTCTNPTSCATTLTISANNNAPAIGQSVTFQGRLTGFDGSPIAGKVIKLINVDTNTVLTDSSQLNAQGTHNTDLNGDYVILLPISNSAVLNVLAKFDGGNSFQPSQSPQIRITPAVSPSPTPGGGGTGGTAFRISFDPLFPPASTQQGTVDPITGEAIMDITLPEGAGVKNVYVQFSEDGGVTWGPTPPTVATITLI